MVPDRIALIGFMGAGKTTVGALLAARLGYAFIDTDEVANPHLEFDVLADVVSLPPCALRVDPRKGVRDGWSLSSA